jgi:alpha-D-xyloside xylohydrolase
VLDTPQDQRLHLVDDQYMMGDRLMIAPLFAGEASRTIQMPEGKWHDFWTGEVLQGGTQLTIPASVNHIPVYVKSGSIVPWADVGQHAGAPETRRITARIYGDGSLPFTLTGGNKTLRLSWSNGRGSAEGDAGGYDVHSWKIIG